MSGSRPVRTGVSLIVGLVSLVVLGVVWGTVVLHLPKQQEPASSATMSPPTNSSVPAVAPPSLSPTQSLVEPFVPARPSPLPMSESPAPQREERSGDPPRSQLPPISANVELKCQAELEQLCPEGEGGGHRRRCLQTNKHKLTPVCQRVVQERMVQIKEGAQRMKAACEADVRQFCRNVPGPGRILQCLEEHAQDVSEQCYRSLPRRGVLN